jgi:hypothetical protein
MQRSEAQMTPQQHAQRIEQVLTQARQECKDDKGWRPEFIMKYC